MVGVHLRKEKEGSGRKIRRAADGLPGPSIRQLIVIVSANRVF